MPVDGAHHSWLRQLALGPDIPEREAILRAFGEHLRSLRVTAGLTQEKLGARCFLTHGRMSDLEHGQTEPRLTVVLMLAHGLGVPPGELIAGLAAPSRQAGRAQILAVLARQPAISPDGLVEALGLPYWYVLENMRSLESFGEIVHDPAGWQPVSTQAPSGERR
jgi:transcriptional regulator with XRE-family HTH domain